MKNKSDVTAKPYNRCLTCPHRKVRCDGPRTSAMALSRWCEFMKDMKEANGLTYAYITEVSGVSQKTLERIFSQNCEQDIMRETARRIEDAIIGSSNQNPCYLAFEENANMNDAMRELERALADNQDYRAALDNIHSSYKAEMETIRKEAEKERIDAQKKIDYLKEQAARLQRENDNLWAENNRKSKVIDSLIGSVFIDKK